MDIALYVLAGCALVGLMFGVVTAEVIVKQRKRAREATVRDALLATASGERYGKTIPGYFSPDAAGQLKMLLEDKRIDTLWRERGERLPRRFQSGDIVRPIERIGGQPRWTVIGYTPAGRFVCTARLANGSDAIKDWESDEGFELVTPPKPQTVEVEVKVDTREATVAINDLAAKLKQANRAARGGLLADPRPKTKED